MKNKTKNTTLFLLLSLALGAAAAAAVWLFFQLMNHGIHFFFTTLPHITGLPFLPFITCSFGGIIIGLYRKRFGDYPETMEVVMATVKREGSYPYHKLHILFFAALLPIIFGASIGPEAGLTGVIVGLCCYAGDRMKYAGQELRDLTQIGISASLGVIFNAPMFGFMMPLEAKDGEESVSFPKSSKILAIFTAILGGLLAFSFLAKLAPGGSGMPRFEKADIAGTEQLLAIPLSVVGGCMGILFFGAEKLWEKVFSPLKNLPLVTSFIGGIVIGLFGIFMPLVLFSGEHQIETLIEHHGSMAFPILLAVCILKLLLTPFCIKTGFKGGHIFPVIFAGVAMGYAAAAILPVDPVFAVTITTAALTGSIMRKPLAAALLLILCFPVSAVLWMFIAAFIGSKIPVPERFKESSK